MKLSDRTRPILSTDQTRWFIPSDSRWLEEFHRDLSQSLQHIERCFNEFLDENRSLNEQIKLIDDFIQQIKTIETICSHIRSPSLFACLLDLKNLKNHLKRQVNNEQITDELIRLFWNVLRTIQTYIQTYCQAFLIPYSIEVVNQDNQSIDIEQLIDAVIIQLYFFNTKTNISLSLVLI